MANKSLVNPADAQIRQINPDTGYPWGVDTDGNVIRMVEHTHHTGPTAPISLNAANNFEIELLEGASRVTIQARLFTNKTYLVHWRVAYDTGLDATTLTSAEGFMVHGGAVVINLDPAVQAYLYVLVTDADGAAQNGGVADGLYIAFEVL